MSELYEFATKFQEVAKSAFAELIDAQEVLSRSEERARKYPQKKGADVHYSAKSAQAASDLKTASDNFNRLKNDLPERAGGQVRKLRAALEQAITRAYAVRPGEVDEYSMTLLNSGVCRLHDFEFLLNYAENHTMKRIVGHYAAKAAVEAEQDGDKETARKLRYISQQGADDGRGYLLAFDRLTDIFLRSVKNPLLIPRWNEFSKPLLDIF